MDEPLPVHLQAPRWRLWYRRQMIRGLETCRRCGVRRRHASIDPYGLRFGHIIAASLGGSNGPDNITITCFYCEIEIGPTDQSKSLRPLCEEQSWFECANAWDEDKHDLYLEAMYDNRRDRRAATRRRDLDK